MASGVTNAGKAWILEVAFRDLMNGGALVDDMYVALIKSTVAPTIDHDKWSDLKANQIATGNGYLDGGADVARGASSFDVISDVSTSETNDYGHVQLTNIEWAASGGSIPDSGDGARYALLLDKAGAAKPHDNNKIIAWWDLGSDRSVTNGQTLSLQDMEIRLS